jgi:hypothetical protein
VAADLSSGTAQKRNADPLSTMLTFTTYKKHTWNVRTTVPYTSVTEDEYRLCIIRVLRPPLLAETDRIKVRNPSTTVAGKPLKIQMGTTRIQIHTEVFCSLL